QDTKGIVDLDREWSFGCLRAKIVCNRQRDGPRVAASARTRRPPVEPVRQNRELDLLSIELGGLDAVTQFLSDKRGSRSRTGFETCAYAAQNLDDFAAPIANEVIDTRKIVRIQQDAALDLRENGEQQNIDVDTKLVLQRKTGMRDAFARIKRADEAPH